MIKSLIASALLSASIGAQTIQPRQARGNSYYGAYNIREWNDNSFFADYDLNAMFDYNDSTGKFYVYGAYYGSTYHNYESYYSFSISTLADSGGAYGIQFYFGGDEDTTTTIEYNFYNDNTYEDTDLCELVIYFPQSVYLDSSNAYVFDYFFTQTANAYHSYYTGWYTFSESQQLNNSWSLMGNITANNTLYNFLGKGAGIYAYFNNDEVSIPTYYLYSSSQWNCSRSIYLTSVLMPNTIKNIMSTTGSFSYVPNTEQSDLKDLFMTIADTPIKLLTNMFHFELLGFDLGVAILSILTLLIIVIIVKKIV